MFVCLPGIDQPASAMVQEMEDMFRRTIPQEARYGSRFVFRQVHPHVLGKRVLTAAEDNLLVSKYMYTCTYVHVVLSRQPIALLQGNPLVPDDLRMVAASRAAVTCVVSDTSRWRMGSHMLLCARVCCRTYPAENPTAHSRQQDEIKCLEGGD